MDLVNSIMASINLDNSGGGGSAPHAESLARRCGSVREKQRIRKQPHAIHAIKKLEGKKDNGFSK